MLRFKEGDQAAFDLLYKRYFQEIMNFFFYHSLSRELSAELAQEVFIKIFRYRESYEPRAKLKTYLLTIARNIFYNEVRKHRHKVHRSDLDTVLQTNADDDPGPHDVIMRRDILDKVQEVITVLPPNQRSAIVLTRFNDLSYEEAAHVMNTTVKAVKSLLNRARKNIVRKMGGA